MKQGKIGRGYKFISFIMEDKRKVSVSPCQTKTQPVSMKPSTHEVQRRHTVGPSKMKMVAEKSNKIFALGVQLQPE